MPPKAPSPPALRQRIAAAWRRLHREAGPVDVSPITGLPLDHLDAGLHTGRRGLASAALFHGALGALIVLGVFTAEEITDGEDGFELPGLVFLVEEGPGGGGGGGGDETESDPAENQLEGEDLALAAVVTAPDPADLVFDDPDASEVDQEMLEDAIRAPFADTMPDAESLAGLLRDASSLLAGPGRGGGAGTGQGGGIGEGDGDGIGEGFGGGFGGGAYRIGSGVQPPQLRRQVTPEYTDDALARKIEGVVVLEVVILSSGRVGPARIVRSLDAGLDEKAIAAVREWLFVPGSFRGEAVDVLAEIEVEFRLL